MFDILEKLSLLAFGLTILLGLIVFFVQSTNSFKLLRRMNAKTARGGAGAVLMTLGGIARRHPGALFSRDRSFFSLVRNRVEHEIFDPRPEFRWPLPDDDDDYGRETHRLLPVRGDRGKDGRRGKRRDPEPEQDRGTVRSTVLATYQGKMRTWRRKMGGLRKNQVIVAETAGQLNDNLSAIKRYFDTLRTLDIPIETDPKFLCPVEVKTGFIAPLHLLAGLLVRYSDKWEGIIRGFERETQDITDLWDLKEEESENFRQIQSFIYHCWLLWGPSIPICAESCSNWKANYTSVQYGFGDENNSIEVFGSRADIGARIAKLREAKPGFKGMALPASVYGQLQYSSIAETKGIPPALSKSWGKKYDERPILHLAARSGEKLENVDHEIEPEQDSDDQAESRSAANRSRYYSAYLWVMFIVLRNSDGVWRPLYGPRERPQQHAIAGSEEAWKASIPFFEHANLADSESCAYGKRQLAAKALAGLSELVAQIPEGNCDLRFAYACAVDHSNCGHPPAFPGLSGDSTLMELMETRLSEVKGDCEDPLENLLRDCDGKKMVDFRFFQDADLKHPHSACHMPSHIRKHYDLLDPLIADE